MPLQPIPIASKKSQSKPFNAQRLVNMYAEADQSGKGVFVALPMPGWVEFADTGVSPYRGGAVLAGELYVISGLSLYHIASDGTATNKGAIAGAGIVSTATNKSNQIAIVSSSESYVYDKATDTLSTISSADSDFVASSSVATLDGYGIFTKRDDDGFFITDLNNFTAIDPLDVATAEGQPDKLVRAFVDHRELWLFGEETTEIWYNSGNATFPFERIPGAYLEKGLLAKWSVAKLDNAVYFLGDDRHVYRAAKGISPEIISDPWLVAEIEGFAVKDDAEAVAYWWNGHPFYELTFPTAGRTFVFDAIPLGDSSYRWYEKESFDKTRCRLSGAHKAYDKIIVGDAFSGKLYALSNDTYTEAGTHHIRTIQSSPLFSPGETITINKLEILIEAGTGTTDGPGADPVVMLRFSADGGKTFGNEITRGIGKIGEYTRRVVFDNLGSFPLGCVLQLRFSDPAKFAVMGIYLDTEGALQ